MTPASIKNEADLKRWHMSILLFFSVFAISSMSIMVRLPDALPAPQVVATLRAQGITTDARSQTLRLSPGIMTTDAGTDRLIVALKALL